MKKIHFLLLISLLLAACSDDDKEKQPAFVTNITISDAGKTFNPGDAVTVKADGLQSGNQIILDIYWPIADNPLFSRRVFTLHTRRYHGANHQQHYFPCPRTLARLTGRNVPWNRPASASRPDFGSRRTIPRRTISLRYHQLPRHLHTDRSPRHHPYRPGNTRNIGSNPVP